MSYLNITAVGNVGRDPEFKYTPAGQPVADFSLAVNETWTNAAGEKQERTTWLRVAAWGKTAEIVNQYVKKGRQLMVIGHRVVANAYIDKNQAPAASLDFTADRIVLLGSANGNNGGDHASYDDFAPPADNMTDIPF